MSELQDVNRGAHARAALENPLIVEALEAFEQEITNQWKNSPLRDVEGREKLRMLLEAQNKFRQYLQSTMDNAAIAREVIEQQSALHRAGQRFLNSLRG
ncbi:hypothetical protein IP84_17010 [beta proteobacterium AAP99]|nr:hypothetical protein IP84_17010 [beta proteobacterium AAP99]